MSVVTELTGCSLQYWECSCSYLVSTTQGLHIMPTRVTKGSLSLTYLLFSIFLASSYGYNLRSHSVHLYRTTDLPWLYSMFFLSLLCFGPFLFCLTYIEYLDCNL